jgi:hypothetical protein
MTIWNKFGFIQSSSSKEENFPFFKQSAMAAILDVGRVHSTQVCKRTTQGVSHPSLCQISLCGYGEDQNVKS